MTCLCSQGPYMACPSRFKLSGETHIRKVKPFSDTDFNRNRVDVKRFVLPGNRGRSLLERSVTWTQYWKVRWSFSSGKKDNVFLEGRAGIRGDQRQRVYGSSGMANCPVGLGRLVYGGKWESSLQRQAGKGPGSKGARVLHGGCWAWPIKPVEAFQQWESLVFGRGADWLLQPSMLWDRPG